VVKVVHENLGIRHGQITTIHDPTNTNLVVDAPHKDLRRARSAMLSLAPTTTGSATAIALIYPELKGKLNGHAVRAPVLNASLTDCVFELQRETTAEEVNALFQPREGPLAGILGYEERPLVSADYARDTRSSIVDALSTMVTDGTLLKVYAWYDNEMGYACRMVDLACHMASVGPSEMQAPATHTATTPSSPPPTGASRSPMARCACWCCCTSTAWAIRRSRWPSCSCSTRRRACWPT
jgi:glyceraldehyde 3-phosphate dehydrogenase